MTRPALVAVQSSVSYRSLDQAYRGYLPAINHFVGVGLAEIRKACSVKDVQFPPECLCTIFVVKCNVEKSRRLASVQKTFTRLWIICLQLLEADSLKFRQRYLGHGGTWTNKSIKANITLQILGWKCDSGE